MTEQTGLASASYSPLCLQFNGWPDSQRRWVLRFQKRPTNAIILEGNEPTREEIIHCLLQIQAPIWMIDVCEIAVAVAKRIPNHGANQRPARRDPGAEMTETLKDETAAVGHDGKAWPQTMDAKVWADEFCKRNSASDHGTMLGWFANAIMIGYDTARWEFEGAQEAKIYLTPAEREEKQAIVNSAMRSMLDNITTPNAPAQGCERSEHPAGA